MYNLINETLVIFGKLSLQSSYILGLLLGSSFLDRIPGNHHLNKIEVPVHLALEEDVWTTGHNISVHGDRDFPEDFRAMVFTNRQNFEFPPSM